MKPFKSSVNYSGTLKLFPTDNMTYHQLSIRLNAVRKLCTHTPVDSHQFKNLIKYAKQLDLELKQFHQTLNKQNKQFMRLGPLSRPQPQIQLRPKIKSHRFWVNECGGLEDQDLTNEDYRELEQYMKEVMIGVYTPLSARIKKDQYNKIKPEDIFDKKALEFSLNDAATMAVKVIQETHAKLRVVKNESKNCPIHKKNECCKLSCVHSNYITLKHYNEDLAKLTKRAKNDSYKRRERVLV